MSSFLQQAIDKYKQLAGPEYHNLKKVSTPFYDDKIARPVETEAETIASRVLMKLLFAARMARYDLLRAVQGLASRVTKWSSDCDKAFHRLMCYVNSTKDYTMKCFIGDAPSECKLWLFADSDHAGEHDNKSTSGGILVLAGPNTYHPLAGFSKKQTSTALSSTEAEVVCANVALRALGLPSSALWSVLLNAGGGDMAPLKAPTPLTRESKPFNAKSSPLPELGKITVTGLQELDDGRVIEVFNRLKVIPPPDNLTPFGMSGCSRRANGSSTNLVLHGKNEKCSTRSWTKNTRYASAFTADQLGIIVAMRKQRLTSTVRLE